MNLLKDLKYYFLKIINDILVTSLLTFVIFLALENLKTGLITNYFDLNLLLIIAAGCVIILILFDNNDLKEEISKINFLFYFLFVIIILILLYLNLPLSSIFRIIITLIIFIILITNYLVTRKYD